MGVIHRSAVRSPACGGGSGWGPVRRPRRCNTTGYGVYWPVILQIAKTHGVPGARGGDGLSAKAIYQALRAGHPVEVWVETGFVRPPTGTWISWDGRTIAYSLHGTRSRSPGGLSIRCG